MATIVGGTGTYMLAAHDKDYKLSKVEIGRPDPGPTDVMFDVKFCGQCHSDLHTINGEWGVDKYPIAVGHELGGIVTAVGAEVKKFKVGDKVAVGCMVASCFECGLCDEGLEQHCPGMCQTYSNMFPKGHHHDECSDTWTNGGYSTKFTCHERFAYVVPEDMPLEIAGPLCCAGITVFSPLDRHVKPGMTVGVVGLGGLGMMAVKIAVAMGAKVTVFSRSLAKKDDAAKLGADIAVWSDSEQMGKLFRTFDVILDTVAQPHDINSLISTLKPHKGIMTMLGGVPKPYEVGVFPMIFNGTRIEGSLIGGSTKTQEMLDFCAKHKCYPDIKVIHAKDAEAALRALDAGTAGAIRSVIDCTTIPEM
eukprot:gb/GFBE01012742.1/.p1 GENE.gb/GFBE01012742.1/~~gb/GFBE01012742.1/.p1  ORF type:complete len:363 (+),score=110.72 gb/GFBE01012742.1/:1-1089(+)